MPQAARLGISTPKYYGLELNGISMGFINSFAGGNTVGNVVVGQPDYEHGIVRKHIAGVTCEELVLTCGADMAQPFYDWLATTLNSDSKYQTGAVVAYDYNFAEVWRLNFFDAMVSEIGFPELDASSKDAATLSVKLAPQYTVMDISKAGAKASVRQKPQENWLLSNFSLNIDGLDCTTVTRIEATTVTQVLKQNQTGGYREDVPLYKDASNLRFTLLQDSRASALYDWFQSFAVEGHYQEKNGSLEFRAANMQDVLFTLGFRYLGIFRLAPVVSNDESASKIEAEMYCGQMTIALPGGAMTSTTTTSTTAQPGQTSSTQPSLPANVRQLGPAATRVQLQSVPKTAPGQTPRLPAQVGVGGTTRSPNQVPAGSTTPSQGPRNLTPLQQQPTIPRPPTLRFRNLSNV